jgi:hypothetical protein
VRLVPLAGGIGSRRNIANLKGSGTLELVNPEP